MSKISLVAGGAGFIGSHLCTKLLRKGNKVICLDNLSTGNKKNIQPFLDNKNFRFIQGDVTDSVIFQDLNNFRIKEIYHLASPAAVTYIVEYPVDAAEANSIGTKNLLKLALKKNAKFLFASSSEVYGNPKEHPQKETYWGNVNPVGVRSGYDEGKRFGEALTMGYARQYNVDVKIVRIFNTYGSNSSSNDSRVIPQFLMQALRSKPLTVHGDGTQTRSLCFVSDLVEGIMLAMESEETGPINLGNPEEYGVIDIAHKIIFLTKSFSKTTFVERPKDDPNKRRPDISFAHNKLKWSPKVSFSQGLEKTIKYFRGIIKEY